MPSSEPLYAVTCEKRWHLFGYCVSLSVFVLVAIPVIPMSLEWYLDGLGREMKQRMFIAIPIMAFSGASALWFAKHFFRQTRNEN
jgi:hypothetical protein